MAETMSFDNQGRFLLLDRKAFGTHSLMISINLEYQLVQASLMSLEIRSSQFTASNSSQALSKLAWVYLQIFLGLTVTCSVLHFHLIDSETPQWSEFPSGGIVEQSCNWEGLDIRARSISEEFPFGLK